MAVTINADNGAVSGSAGLKESADSSGVLALQTNGTTAVTIDTSQNVGIGTSSPSGKLHVFGTEVRVQQDASYYSLFNTAGTRYGYIQGGAGYLDIVSEAGSANILRFTTNSAERMRIDASGNVGIGATTNNVYDQVAAARPLVVQKSDTSTTLNGSTASITVTNGDTTTSNTAQLNFAAITGANASQFSSAIISTIFGARTNGQYPTGQLVFSTSTSLNAAPSEKMRIASDGVITSGLGGMQVISGTAVASTSGTSINFTSIPSWVKRITVMFSGVSLNGASEPMIQIGTGGTPTTSGYAGRSAFAGASAGTVGYGAGFITFVDATATNTLYGQAILSLLNSSTNTWAYTAIFAASDVAYTTVGGGSVPLSGSLNMVRITTVNGTDAFDAGTINILYE